MPGLLTVGVPYVMATFGQRHGARVMGWYVGSLVVGGLIGRVGVSLLTAAIGWRGALGAIAFLPLVAAARDAAHRCRSRRSRRPADPRCASRWRSSRATARCSPRRRSAAALFFSFVGIFSYAEYRLAAPAFSLGTTASSLIFLLWLFGGRRPARGARRRALRLAPRRARRPSPLGRRRAAHAARVAADDVRRPRASSRSGCSPARPRRSSASRRRRAPSRASRARSTSAPTTRRGARRLDPGPRLAGLPLGRRDRERRSCCSRLRGGRRAHRARAARRRTRSARGLAELRLGDARLDAARERGAVRRVEEVERARDRP